MNLIGVIVLFVAFLVGVALLAFGRVTKRIGLLVLIIVVCSVTFLGWKYHQYDSGYDRIEIGFTQEQIIAMLGKPTQATNCTTSYGVYPRGPSEKISSGCTEEYCYYSFFTPEAWSYSFDGEKKLIDKFHWHSP